MFTIHTHKAGMMSKTIMLAFLYICFIVSALQAQEQRPKVGIVLSGGGAKGMAHIGVIRALEDNGIPIDYICGTSVGAIVGGLYASGYTPDEMEAIFNSPKFAEWLKGNIDEKYISFFKKESPTPDWVQPSLKVDSSGINIIIPTNFISPLLIDYEFLSIYTGATVAAKENFDSLLVPFRCCAADLNRQKPHYFQSGDLGLAIRASMTFPFLFNPIVMDSTVYFDGGIYDNFPVKAMQKDFAPDVIIGCQVAENFPPPKEGDIVSYLQKMIAQHTDYDLGEAKGIIMVPEIGGGLNVTDFSEACHYSEKGYEIVMKNLDSINKLVNWKIDKKVVQEKRKKFVAKIPPLIIDSVDIKGVNHVQEIYIRQLLGSGKKRTYTIEQMRDYYFRMFSDKNIKYVHPTLIYDTVNHTFILELNMKIGSTLTPRIGGYISAGSNSEAFLQLDYRRLQRVGIYSSLNAYLGRFYNSFKVSARVDIPSRLPFYVAPDYTFNDWDYFSSELLRADAPSLSHLTQNEQHIMVEIGFPTTKRGKLSLHPSFNREEDRYLENNIIQPADEPNKTIFSSFSLGLKLEESTLNKPQYPSFGRSISLVLTGVIGEESLITPLAQKSTQSHKWVQAKYNFNQYIPIGKHYSLGLSLNLFASNQQSFFNYASTLLHTGVFAPTVESSQRFMPEYRTNIFAAPGVQNVVRLGDYFQIRTEAYLFLPVSINTSGIPSSLSMLYDNIQHHYQYVFSAGLVYHSYIGPISLLFNYHSRDKGIDPTSVILNIGYVFFNRKGLER